MKNSSKAVEPIKAVEKKKAGAAKEGRFKRAETARETIGIDLGDKVSRYAILDESGELVEEGSFRKVVSSMEQHFGGETKPAQRRTLTRNSTCIEPSNKPALKNARVEAAER